MGWQIEFDSDVEKELRKLDKQIQKRILTYLRDRIAPSENPRLFGKPLQGQLAGLWRYRVGDHRIICQIHHQTVTILVVKVGHRKDIYH